MYELLYITDTFRQNQLGKRWEVTQTKDSLWW